LSLRKIVAVTLLLVVVTSFSASAQAVELLVNGSFTNGLTGWDVRGTVYAEETGAHLRGQGGITTVISQTIARSDLSSNLVISYRITTVIPRGEGGPYAKVSVVGYDSKGSEFSLYSEKYGKKVDTVNTYSPTVRLGESDSGRAFSSRFERIVVVFETGFDDIYSRETNCDVYVGVASLRLSAPTTAAATTSASITATTTSASITRTTSTTQMTTASETPAGSYDVFIILGAVIAVAVVAVIFLMKRKTKSPARVTSGATLQEKTTEPAEDIKYCIQCGNSIPSNSRHCGKCGAAQE
jgi:hypothetical protein